MKSCVIFAVSVFDTSRLFVLHEFLTTFKKMFNDCDLYIGINYNSCLEIEEIIKTYDLNAVTERLTDVNLYCGSDASAYQLALKLLKESKQTYDIYWFAHTKGAVNDRPYERNMYLTTMFQNRNEIESFFEHHEFMGSFGLRGVSRSAGNINWNIYNKDHEINICSNVIDNDLPYNHVNWSYIETMYVINKQSVETFLKIATDSFYNTKITEPCYFETVFPWVVTRCGYFPYVYQNNCFFGEKNLKEITAEWIHFNNLKHLNDYLTL